MMPTTTTMTPPTRANHQLETKPETASNMRVGRGSVAWNDLKKTWKRGSTKVARTTTVTTAMTSHDGGIDEGRGDLPPGVDVALDVVGELVQHGVERAGQLGRGEDADVVIGERFRVRRRRGGKGVAGLQPSIMS